MDKLKQSCWIIVEDGLIGTENQCLGVAESLGMKPEIKRINLREPWKTLTPYIGLENARSFTGAALESPLPDIVIAAGRKSIAACRYIKKHKPSCFVVYIQDPRVSPAQFDLVALPAHDPTRGENVIVTTGAPNRITKKRLSAAKKDFKELAALPSPRLAVLIGGDSKEYEMSAEGARLLAQQLLALDAGLMVTISRRTSAENEHILRDTLKDKDHCFFWNGTGENPYFAMLALADTILVTADSASMLSESCTTGKPVYMIPMQPKGDKPMRRIDKLHQRLQDLGCIRTFDGKLETWEYTPLKDAALIAKEIKKRIENRDE